MVSYKEYEQVEEILDERDSKDRVRKIQSVLSGEEKKWKAKYPFLNHYNTIAMIVLAATLITWGAAAYLYLNALIPWYVASIVIGMCVGLHHEIEHDIIHNLYFKNNTRVQDALFGLLFLTKFHISPWVRKVTHWKHHRVSGQLNDVEERFVGMGEPLGIRRLFLSIHPNSVYTQIKNIKDDSPQFDFIGSVKSSVLPFTVWQLLTKFLVMYHVIAFFYPTNPYGILPESFYYILKNIFVLWLLPSMLRSSSLIILTSNCHFYKDIPKNNLFYQCQILDHPIFYFFALFTCDFGATHIVHHYNALQPFFIRQLCRGAAMEEMRKQGVRVNDWGVILRQNAFHRKPQDASKEKAVFFLYIFVLVVLSPLWLVLGDISFLTDFTKDKIRKTYLNADEGSVETDDNDNREVRCA